MWYSQFLGRYNRKSTAYVSFYDFTVSLYENKISFMAWNLFSNSCCPFSLGTVETLCTRSSATCTLTNETRFGISNYFVYKGY
jgi:hypothetical protein